MPALSISSLGWGRSWSVGRRLCMRWDASLGTSRLIQTLIQFDESTAMTRAFPSGKRVEFIREAAASTIRKRF